MEVINDKNDLLITFYKQCMTNFDALQQKITTTLHSESEYNRAKRIYNSPKWHKKIDIAWAVFVVTNMSVLGTPRGGWKRDNGTGGSHIGVAMESYRNEFTKQVHNRLKNVQISCRDAIDVISERDSAEAFFYLDPPYIGCDQKHYKGYTEKDFHELLEKISGIHGKFILSSFWSDMLGEYIEQGHWNYKIIERKCMIPAIISKPVRKREVLTYNFDIEPTLFD